MPMYAGKGSFECRTASRSRIRPFGQDDSCLTRATMSFLQLCYTRPVVILARR